MKKYIFIAFLSLTIFSCDEFEYGHGENPELNISSYTFSNKGDSIVIYSKKGYSGLIVGASYSMETSAVELFYSGIDKGSRGYYGDWWYAACPDERPHGSSVVIVVQPNDTGEERVIPIFIMYGDWGGGGKKYIQEK